MRLRVKMQIEAIAYRVILALAGERRHERYDTPMRVSALRDLKAEPPDTGDGYVEDGAVLQEFRSRQIKPRCG